MKVPNPLKSTVTASVFVAPVAPPTWKDPAAAVFVICQVPVLPVTLSAVVCPTAVFTPITTLPVLVSILPGPIVMTFGVAVFVCTFMPPKVELPFVRSNVETTALALVPKTSVPVVLNCPSTAEATVPVLMRFTTPAPVTTFPGASVYAVVRLKTSVPASAIAPGPIPVPVPAAIFSVAPL